MASLPRANAVANPPTAVASSARLPSALRGVASGGAVEEPVSGQGISFNVGEFLFQDYGRSPGNETGGEQNSDPHARYGSRFKAPSQAFAAMLEVPALQDGNFRSGVSGDAPRKGSAGLLTRAVATYEMNAKVISGGLEPKGTNFSFTL